MRVYHFVRADWALENIQRRRLKIATYGNLNDPFEWGAVAVRNSAARSEFARAREAWGGRFGLLCFSRSWRNPVQWSHYADRHRGLCLGFDIPEENAVPVDYRARPYPERTLRQLEDLPLSDAQDLMRKVLATKYSHWRYEQEVRIFADLAEPDPENGHYFADFSPELALVEIIVGHRSNVTRQQLTKALGTFAGHVTARKARLSFQSFRVVTQRDPSKWS